MSPKKTQRYKKHALGWLLSIFKANVAQKTNLGLVIWEIPKVKAVYLMVIADWQLAYHWQYGLSTYHLNWHIPHEKDVRKMGTQNSDNRSEFDASEDIKGPNEYWQFFTQSLIVKTFWLTPTKAVSMLRG